MASELSQFIEDELLRQGSTPGAGRHAHASPPPVSRNASGGLDGELSNLIEEEMTRSSMLNPDGNCRRRHTLGIEAVKQLEGKSGRPFCSARTLLFSLLGFGMLMLLIVFINGHSGSGDYGDDFDDDSSEGLKRRPAGISDPNAMFGLDDEDFSDLYDAYADYGEDEGDGDIIGGGTYYEDDYEEGELDGADDDDGEDDYGDDDAGDDGSGDGDGGDEGKGGDKDDGDGGR